MSDKTRALLYSFLRVLGGCAVTAVTTVIALQGYGPLDFTSGDWKTVGNAVVGAVLVTGGNYFRTGETRFGRGSEDIGMGGDDNLEVPGGEDTSAVVPGG